MPNTAVKQFGPLIISFAITGVCLFGSAGRLNWSNAWLLLGLSFAAGLACTIRRSPELSAERRNVRAGKSWDKVIVSFVVLVGPMAVWIAAGLDDRFHWSNSMPVPALPLGIALAVLAAALIAWAMHTNKFFSSVVRIQKDRGHIVIDRGPYRFVRHPGYAGMAAFTLATPLILNSYWAFAPAAATAAVIALRTVLEDRTLDNELDGYSDYARRVRYKWLPAIW